MIYDWRLRDCRFSIPADISPVEVDEEHIKQVIKNVAGHKRREPR